MPILDLFSRRQKKLRGEIPDVFIYDNLPQPLRVQIVHIFSDCFAFDSQYGSIIGFPVKSKYAEVDRALAKELGLFTLGERGEHPKEAVLNYILREENFENTMSAIEFILQVIEYDIGSNYAYLRDNNVQMQAKPAIDEINARFKENGVGFEYINGQFIKIDSKFLHNEAVRPALALLDDKMYVGANAEFRKAFEEYKKGGVHNKDALVEALKAFESVLKAICDKQKWAYDSKDTASKLVKIVIDSGLLPAWQSESLTGVRLTLETVGTPRNKMGGHGQGSNVVSVPDYYVRYALNATASAIILLAEAEQAMP